MSARCTALIDAVYFGVVACYAAVTAHGSPVLLTSVWSQLFVMPLQALVFALTDLMAAYNMPPEARKRAVELRAKVAADSAKQDEDAKEARQRAQQEKQEKKQREEAVSVPLLHERWS